MAIYKYGNYLEHSNHEAFDIEWTPGSVPDHSGIYRCRACGDEAACNKGNPLPPQNHRQHNPNQGPIRWKLLVYSVQE